MTHPVFLILPALACFFWALVHLLMASRVNTFKVFFFTLLVVGLAALADSGAFFHGNTLGVTARSRLALQLLAPSIIPMLMVYLNNLVKDKRYRHYQFHWLAIPSALFTAALILTIIIGEENVNELLTEIHTQGAGIGLTHRGSPEFMYFFITDGFFRMALIIELVAFLTFVVIKSRKLNFPHFTIIRFFRGEAMSFKALQFGILSITVIIVAIKFFTTANLFQAYSSVTVIWSCLFTLFICFVSFLALFSSQDTISLQQIRYAFMNNYGTENKTQVLRTMMREIEDLLGDQADVAGGAEENTAESGPESISSKLFSASLVTGGTLIKRIQQLMVEEQLFLQPGLSLQDVADRLGSNKTYISKLVNNTYNMGFPELVNVLRVDYAQQYLIQNREAKQSEVAAACGFQSASSFNIIFKKVTGVTPKVWLAQNEE